MTFNYRTMKSNTPVMSVFPIVIRSSTPTAKSSLSLNSLNGDVTITSVIARMGMGLHPSPMNKQPIHHDHAQGAVLPTGLVHPGNVASYIVTTGADITDREPCCPKTKRTGEATYPNGKFFWERFVVSPPPCFRVGLPPINILMVI